MTGHVQPGAAGTAQPQRVPAACRLEGEVRRSDERQHLIGICGVWRAPRRRQDQVGVEAVRGRERLLVEAPAVALRFQRGDASHDVAADPHFAVGVGDEQLLVHDLFDGSEQGGGRAELEQDEHLLHVHRENRTGGSARASEHADGVADVRERGSHSALLDRNQCGEQPLRLHGIDRLDGKAGSKVDIVGSRTGHGLGDPLCDLIQPFAD